MSHLRCTVNMLTVVLDYSQGFSLRYGIINLLLEAVQNVVNSTEQEPRMQCCVRSVCTVEYQHFKSFFGLHLWS